MDQSIPSNYLDSEKQYYAKIEAYYAACSGTYSEKMHAISRFVPRQALSYFMARNEVYKQILELHGAVLDFGIFRGSSFFTWLQFSAVYEPYNHIRKVIGFDSFEGFSGFGGNDKGAQDSSLQIKTDGGMAYANGQAELLEGIALYDMNRPLGHVGKGQIVQGHLPESVQGYMQQHPETIIAMANFGLGLYEPTLEILKAIKPRLQKGSILLFEDLNQSTWPGETRALYEVFEPYEITLHRVPYCPHLSWMKVAT
jgi:hypothetical protein